MDRAWHREMTVKEFDAWGAAAQPADSRGTVNLVNFPLGEILRNPIASPRFDPRETAVSVGE